MLERNPSDIYQLRSIKNLSEVICEKLSELIFQGYIKPGEHLVQTDLAERFSVSRITIRDAFHLLLQTGLVEKNGNGGVIVKSLTRKDIENIATLRELIEPYIASTACLNIDDNGINNLQQIVSIQKQLRDNNNYIGYIKSDWNFHKALYDYSGNELAVTFMEGFWHRLCQARGMIFVNEQWGEEWITRSISGHEKMVQAVKEKDTNTLVDIIHSNISSALKEQLMWFDHIEGISG